jgi:hypothetical protein
MRFKSDTGTYIQPDHAKYQDKEKPKDAHNREKWYRFCDRSQNAIVFMDDGEATVGFQPTNGFPRRYRFKSERIKRDETKEEDQHVGVE